MSAWLADAPRFGIINFANADMVGHTGVIEAAVEAVETVDRCLGEVVAAVHERGGVCVVTADHGNADHMLEPDGSPNTAHSMNPVPLIVTSQRTPRLRAEPGILADVAPTVLELIGIPQPARDDRLIRCWRALMSRTAVSAFFIAAGINHFCRSRGSTKRSSRPRCRRVSARWWWSAGSPRSSAARPCCASRPGAWPACSWSRCSPPCSPPTCTWRASPSASARFPRWALYARLPFQPLMMMWAWRATR